LRESASDDRLLAIGDFNDERHERVGRLDFGRRARVARRQL